MTDRKLTEAEMISYLKLSVAIGNTARLAPEEAQTLLALINRQKAEIERLKNPIPVLCVDELTDELIEELKKQPFLVSPASNENVVFFDESKIKSEAVKEFAERVKEGHSQCDGEEDVPWLIDKLVKEMLEEIE